MHHLCDPHHKAAIRGVGFLEPYAYTPNSAVQWNPLFRIIGRAAAPPHARTANGTTSPASTTAQERTNSSSTASSTAASTAEDTTNGTAADHVTGQHAARTRQQAALPGNAFSEGLGAPCPVRR
jgi:hypothetical protein